MTQEQINAFNTASGTHMSTMVIFITSLGFTLFMLWAAFVFLGKLKMMHSMKQVDIPKLLSTLIRVSIVLIIVLIIFHT